MLISLIVPMYNVEKYIEACLTSISSQLKAEDCVEVILVDDESPDESVQVAKKYLSTLDSDISSKFSFIHQKNKGLSGARNSGIDIAKGQYLAFLDSDDLLGDHYFEKLFKTLKKQSPDIVQFRASRFNDAGQVFDFLKFIRNDGLYDMHAVWNDLCDQSAWFAWLRIYKATLFENIHYPEGKNYEDAYTTPYLYLKAKNIYFLNDVLLKYRYNPNSITATKSKKNIDDLGGAAYKMAENFAVNQQLSSTALSLGQSYINDSLLAEDYKSAKKRWKELKSTFIKNGFSEELIRNRGNRLFYNFGILFLVFENSLRQLGIRK